MMHAVASALQGRASACRTPTCRPLLACTQIPQKQWDLQELGPQRGGPQQSSPPSGGRPSPDLLDILHGWM